MNIDEVSNGFGQIIPHSIRRLDSEGEPTSQIIAIRTQQDLIDNLRFSGGVDNQILPVPKWETSTTLPSGETGNHFIFAKFTQDIDVASVLNTELSGQSNSGLTGAVSVVALDPITGDSVPIPGRAFVGGVSTSTDRDGDGQLDLNPWVRYEGGRIVAVDPDTWENAGVAAPTESARPGYGFPGSEGTSFSPRVLVEPSTLLFVVDTDGDLSTHETFPIDKQIRFRLTTSVRAVNGNTLVDTVLANSTVGPDTLSPEVSRTPQPLNDPLVTPGNGDVNVDPMTSIRIEFTEPVQPLSVCPSLFGASAPALSGLIQIQFGPAATRTDVPFSIRPVSVFDLSTYEMIPAFQFPGAGASAVSCGTFNRIDITVNAPISPDSQLLRDLSVDASSGLANTNLLGAASFFETGAGPGIVNAPVSPDTILAGRLGALPGISVIDLNGFGQSTGNPLYDDDQMIEGYSNFPNNPNLQSPGLSPPLQIGTCTIDGGSAGVFTLTKDSALDDLVVRPPLVSSIGDMMLGWALDGSFNNGNLTGCFSTPGGNVCAESGRKQISPVAGGPNTLGPAQQLQFSATLASGSPNIVSWAPHPNPPPIVFPPLCVTPFLATLEPTSIDNVFLPFGQVGTTIDNQLPPAGDPFGDPTATPPVRPSGLLSLEQNAFFAGPSQGIPPGQGNSCNIYQIRQQVGQFLYVVDRQRGEVVVFNSNRMTVIDRISTPDPTSLAMGPNLDFLAVTNQQANVVSFIDIKPNSSSFHEVTQTTVVGNSPRGIAWDPANEDVLVCNELDNTVSVISALSLEVRNVVSSQLNRPFEVAITPRQVTFGFARNVYFAYILNRGGTVAIFESGPNGVNGWGFDDVIGVAPFTFENPKAIQVGQLNLNSSVWIAHEGTIDPESGDVVAPGEGAVSNLVLESATFGQISLTTGQTGGTANFRGMEFAVRVSVGEDQLSGVPVDIAFDNLRNVAAYENPFNNPFSSGSPVPFNGKNVYRVVPQTLTILNTSEPQFMFAAVPNPADGSGVVDVIQTGASGSPRIDTNPFQPGTQSIPAPNVNILADYFRQ